MEPFRLWIPFSPVDAYHPPKLDPSEPQWTQELLPITMLLLVLAFYQLYRFSNSLVFIRMVQLRLDGFLDLLPKVYQTLYGWSGSRILLGDGS